MSTMPIEIYTDGSSLKNPGASGLAYVIRYWIDNNNGDMPEAKCIEGNQGFRLSTNNRMEIMAGIYGLRKIIELIKTDPSFKDYKQINLSSDSEYFCKAVNQRWLYKWVQNNWMTSGFGGKAPQDVKNKDLWQQFLDIQNELRELGINLNMIHVKGHADNQWNNRADELAVAASNNSSAHIIDEIYEQTSQYKNRM